MIYLAANTDAVDAALVTKERAARCAAADLGLPLPRVAAIGDSVGDLPFLSIPELALRGAPASAQDDVKEALSRMPRSIVVSGEPDLRGFLAFYDASARHGAEHVIADKDGVLVWGRLSESDGAVLNELLRTMGSPDRPTLTILTGSAFEQNREFLESIGAGLESNPWIRRHPHVLWAENGSLRVDVLSGNISLSGTIDEAALDSLTGPFREALLARLDSQVFPRFGLKATHSRDQQDGSVYLPAKRTMVTVNVPRSVGSIRDYRRARESEAFRQEILEAMVLTANILGLPHCRLGTVRPLARAH